MRILLAALAAVALLPSPNASAQSAERSLVGVSRIFNNDFLGDGKDRWRTGSYQASATWGFFGDSAPDRPFALMEYRLRAEILAPESLARTTSFPDRPYAGVIGLGAFTHMERGAYNISFGGELAFVGPSTGLGRFQTWVHERLSIQTPQMLAEQLPNRVYPTVQAEVSRDIEFGTGILRPFGEVQAGLETYARVGFDAVFGRNLSRNFFLRDPVTGQLMTNVRASDDASWGFMVGGDVAFVDSSRLLPVSRGYRVKQNRTRLRAGIVREAEGGGLFYGVTYLGPEFERQREGQVTGSLHLRLNF